MVRAPATGCLPAKAESHLWLLVEPEHEQRESGHHRNVLLAADTETNRAAVDRSAQIRPPQQRARPRIEGLEVAFPPAREQQVGSRRQDAAVAHVGHLELPFPAALERLVSDPG